MGVSSSAQRNSAPKEHGSSLSTTSSTPRRAAPQRKRAPRQMTRSASTDNLPTTDRHEPSPRRRPQRNDVDLHAWIAEARARQRQRNSDTVLAASGGLAWTVELESTQTNTATTSQQTANTRTNQQPAPPRTRNGRRMIRSSSNETLTIIRPTRQQPRSRSPVPRQRRRQVVRSASNEQLHVPSQGRTEQPRSSPQARNRARRGSPAQARGQVVRSNSSEHLSTPRATVQPRVSSPRRRNERQVAGSSSNEHLPTSRQRQRSPPIRSRAFQRVRRSPPASGGPIRIARRVVRSSSNENVSTSSQEAHQRRRNPARRNVRQVVRSTSNENVSTSRQPRSGQRENTRAWIAEARTRARMRETEAAFASGGVSWTIETDHSQTNTTRRAEEPLFPEAVLPGATLHQGEAPPTYHEAASYKSLPFAPPTITQGRTQENGNTEEGDQSKLVPPPSYSDAWK